LARSNLSKNLSKRERAKDARLKREFSITLEQYNQVLKAQGGVCAICKKRNNKKGKPLLLAVDHCHTTGLVRGLLCWPCNKGIAVFQDKAASLYNAYKYMDIPPFVATLGKEIYCAPGRVGSAKRNKLIAKMRKDGQEK
jgi:hypothetical protein